MPSAHVRRAELAHTAGNRCIFRGDTKVESQCGTNVNLTDFVDYVCSAPNFRGCEPLLRCHSRPARRNPDYIFTSSRKTRSAPRCLEHQASTPSLGEALRRRETGQAVCASLFAKHCTTSRARCASLSVFESLVTDFTSRSHPGVSGTFGR